MLLLRLIKESFIFAFDALRQNRVRTFLSLLGITIGIFTIITVFAAVDTFRANLQSSVEKLGSKTIFIEKWPWGGFGDYPWWKYMQRPVPNYRDFTELEERMPSSIGICYQIFLTNRTIKHQNQSINGVRVAAVTNNFDKTTNFEINEGRFLTENEFNSGAPVCVLGADVAEGLFPQRSAIGQEVKLMGRNLTIIGVFAREGEDMLGISTDNNLLIPLNFTRNLVDVESDRYGPQIAVRGNEEMSLEELEAELQGIMRSVRRLGPLEDDNFALNKTTIITAQLDTMFAIVNTAGWIIGGFSILVGGFGIANIMFVSVKERTNIIGIQKSLGAKNFFILSQFLFEAIALCLIGGAIGLAVVYIVTLISTYGFNFRVVLDYGNVIRGITISVIIGVISGFWPAYSASRLDPVEAIRSK